MWIKKNGTPHGYANKLHDHIKPDSLLCQHKNHIEAITNTLSKLIKHLKLPYRTSVQTTMLRISSIPI